MNKKNGIVAIIPARGGSKGLPRKNILSIHGKPLVAWSIEVAKESKLIDKVIVSTEDKEIAGISEEYGAEVPFLRPKEFAMDTSSPTEAILHLIEKLNLDDDDIILELQPTYPIRDAKDIDNCIKKLIITKNAKSIVSISPIENTAHPDFAVSLTDDNFLIKKRTGDEFRRQELSKRYAYTGVILASYVSALRKYKSFYNDATLGFIISEKYKNCDINDQWDFIVTDAVMEKIKNKTDMFSLAGKVAIVTGAARGNGKAIADGLKTQGAVVYYADVLPIKNKFFVKTDITKERELANLVALVVKKHKHIDILVNNAGISKSCPSENYPDEFWNGTLDVNLTAHFKLSRIVAKQMIKQGYGGSIINITSLGSEFGFPNNPAYVASKGGLKALTRALARDWAKYNIRVNNICPGYIHTNMTDKSFKDKKLHKARLSRMMIKRWGKPEDLVGVTVFLASDSSSYITGTDIYVDGGWTANGL